MSSERQSYLFQLDILIEAGSNTEALEKLFRVLNSNELQDFRITKGLELGKTIQAVLSQQKEPLKEFPVSVKDSHERAKAAEKQPSNNMLLNQIRELQQNGALARLAIVKGKGVKLSIPCRIINVDEATSNISVYHVDEKKVYLLRLNEIDDIHVT